VSTHPKADGFGLIIVGDEILDGRRQDTHLASAMAILKERRIPLRWVLLLPDDPAVITSQLQWAAGRPEPYFCCGGIGSTPDDYTRQCAAAAAGTDLELHEEGVRILKRRFGDRATPIRLEMVRFPRGATLIPNPVNEVPGFTLGKGHFLPGFPEMAKPMMRWVLENGYETGAERIRRALVLPGAKEADLVPLMEAFIAGHPEVSFSSLPRFTETGTEVLLGLGGTPERVARGIEDLSGMLRDANIVHEEAEP
jgi:molybdopterin-biosynthesis enzyme MoeA-like protein